MGFSNKKSLKRKKFRKNDEQLILKFSRDKTDTWSVSHNNISGDGNRQDSTATKPKGNDITDCEQNRMSQGPFKSAFTYPQGSVNTPIKYNEVTKFKNGSAVIPKQNKPTICLSEGVRRSVNQKFARSPRLNTTFYEGGYAQTPEKARSRPSSASSLLTMSHMVSPLCDTPPSTDEDVVANHRSVMVWANNQLLTPSASTSPPDWRANNMAIALNPQSNVGLLSLPPVPSSEMFQRPECFPAVYINPTQWFDMTDQIEELKITNSTDQKVQLEGSVSAELRYPWVAELRRKAALANSQEKVKKVLIDMKTFLEGDYKLIVRRYNKAYSVLSAIEIILAKLYAVNNYLKQLPQHLMPILAIYIDLKCRVAPQDGKDIDRKSVRKLAQEMATTLWMTLDGNLPYIQEAILRSTELPRVKNMDLCKPLVQFIAKIPQPVTNHLDYFRQILLFSILYKYAPAEEKKDVVNDAELKLGSGNPQILTLYESSKTYRFRGTAITRYSLTVEERPRLLSVYLSKYSLATDPHMSVCEIRPLVKNEIKSPEIIVLSDDDEPPQPPIAEKMPKNRNKMHANLAITAEEVATNENIAAICGPEIAAIAETPVEETVSPVQFAAQEVLQFVSELSPDSTTGHVSSSTELELPLRPVSQVNRPIRCPSQNTEGISSSVESSRHNNASPLATPAAVAVATPRKKTEKEATHGPVLRNLPQPMIVAHSHDDQPDIVPQQILPPANASPLLTKTTTTSELFFVNAASSSKIPVPNEPLELVLPKITQNADKNGEVEPLALITNRGSRSENQVVEPIHKHFTSWSESPTLADCAVLKGGELAVVDGAAPQMLRMSETHSTPFHDDALRTTITDSITSISGKRRAEEEEMFNSSAKKRSFDPCLNQEFQEENTSTHDLTGSLQYGDHYSALNDLQIANPVPPVVQNNYDLPIKKRVTPLSYLPGSYPSYEKQRMVSFADLSPPLGASSPQPLAIEATQLGVMNVSGTMALQNNNIADTPTNDVSFPLIGPAADTAWRLPNDSPTWSIYDDDPTISCGLANTDIDLVSELEIFGPDTQTVPRTVHRSGTLEKQFRTPKFSMVYNPEQKIKKLEDDSRYSSITTTTTTTTTLTRTRTMKNKSIRGLDETVEKCKRLKMSRIIVEETKEPSPPKEIPPPIKRGRGRPRKKKF